MPSILKDLRLSRKIKGRVYVDGFMNYGNDVICSDVTHNDKLYEQRSECSLTSDYKTRLAGCDT